MNLNSGYPFWLLKNGLPFDYPKLEEDISTDVVVMGGGIFGALVSYYLTNADVEHIVVDGGTIGLGSTCSSTGMLQYEIDTALYKLQHKVGLYNAVRAYRLCDEAIDTLATIVEKIKFNDFEKLQSVYYSADKNDIAFIETEYAIRKKHGFKVSLLDEEAVLEKFAFGAPNAILSEQGAKTNAYTLSHALFQYAIKKGVKVYDRTYINTIVNKKEMLVLKTNNGNKITAKKIVYATGYESIKYISKKIVDLNNTYAICSEQINDNEMPFKHNALLWNTADPYLYLRTTADNRVIIGGKDDPFFDIKKRDKLLDSKKKELVADFVKLYPRVPFNPEFSWCGTYAVTKDGLPLIGTYNGLANSYFAVGFGGNGITFSVIAAEILTDLIIGKKNNDHEIFSFSRM